VERELRTPMSTALKRQKVGVKHAWKASFDQLSTLRHVLEILCNVLDTATFHVSKDGLKLNCIDSKQIAMVELELAHSGFTTDDSQEQEASFCLYAKTLRDCLKASPAHYSLEISNPLGSSDIFLRSFEALSNSHQFEVRIPSIVEDESPRSLKMLDFAAIVEIDMAMLRGIIKTSISLASSDQSAKDCDIRFQIYKSAEENGKSITVLCISSESGNANAAPRHLFVSETSEDGVFRTEDTITCDIDETTLPCTYNESFSAGYLNNFVKSMERQTLQLKCAPGLPLVINYPLGKEGSGLTFILAARVEDS